MKNHIESLGHSKHNNVKIILISTFIGIMSGLAAILYRYALSAAEETSLNMYSFFSDNQAYIPFLFVGLAAVGYGIGLLTKRYSLISGSGIPQVKGRIMGYINGSWLSTLIAKFIGGTASIIAGLSLGREGPSIQLGACVAQGISDKFADTEHEKRIYIASGASAGLAAAFNAPLAGVMFALEEIFKYFSPMVLLSTMVAAVTADFVSKLFFGVSHVFDFEVTRTIPISYYWLFIILGIILGFSGVIYNICLVGSQKIYKKMACLSPQARTIIPFLLAGVLGLTFPIVLCGGHSIIEELDISLSLMFLVVVLLVKFLFSMISFGSGAPGGIFFPLLVLGSTIGAIFAKICIPVLGLQEELFYNFVIIAMAGYFSAIVRAPLTGIILLVEMTGSLSQLLPLIVTSAVAYIVAEELKNKPIYESLLENLLKSRGIEQEPEDTTKILLETIVHIGCEMENKNLRELDLPQNCLIVAIKRGAEEITPNGDTVVKSGDYLTLLTDVSHELAVREQIEQMSSSI